METRDFICVCLGVSSEKVDEICDNFDLDIDSGEVACLLTVCEFNYKTFGDRLIAELYNQVIEDAVKDFGLDEDKFDYYANGRDSHLYYDKQEIYRYKDLENIAELNDEE